MNLTRRCHECDETIYVSQTSEQLLIDVARLRGWHIGVTFNLCPVCRKEVLVR